MEWLEPSRRGRTAIAAAAVLSLLGACAGPTQRAKTAATPPAACNPALCNITQATWQNHIDPRHCQGTCPVDNKSIFVGAYCGSLANAVTFCQTLMGRPSCAGVQQPNGRVAYSADLAGTAGTNRNNACNNTTRGTVIYDPGTAQVVTQFPGNP